MHYNAHILAQKRTCLRDVLPLDTPFTLLIEASRLCNFKCRFCPQSQEDKFLFFDKNLLSIEDFKKILSQLHDFPQKIKKVYMHGTGESLLNPELPEMIRLLKQSGTTESIDLTSNGALLTETLGENLVDAGLDHLHISVEALSSEKYREITGVNSVVFDQFMDKIRTFSTQRGKCRLTIKVAQSSLEEDGDNRKFLELFSPLCDEIFVEQIYPIWPGFQPPESVCSKAGEAGQYGQAVEEKRICPQIFTVLAIKCDGSVSPCSVDWANQVNLGNIHEMRLKQIWEGEQLRQLRRLQLSRGRTSDPYCASCGLPKYSCVDNLDTFALELLQKIM